MIKKKEVSDIVRKLNKKLSANALKKIDLKATNYINSLILSAKKRADICGRVIIRDEDFD